MMMIIFLTLGFSACQVYLLYLITGVIIKLGYKKKYNRKAPYYRTFVLYHDKLATLNGATDEQDFYEKANIVNTLFNTLIIIIATLMIVFSLFYSLGGQ